MSGKINVRKRNGRLEELDIEKIHKVLSWGCDGYPDTSVSEIEVGAKLELVDGISTKEIHNLLIRSANNLISEDAPSYQYVAARLLLFWVRKEVWGGEEPPRLLEQIQENVNKGIYDKFILEKYTETEIHKINRFVNHDRDYDFTYAGLQQLVDKYLCQDRLTGTLHETPQFANILIAMTLFANYPEDCRLHYVRKCYDYISKFKINLPTPIMAGVRTLVRQYSSCCLIDIDDSMEGIMSAATSVAYYSSKRAGIGINLGRIRPIGSPIRKSEVVHTGVIPYAKIFEATVKSCSQNGIRGANATVTFPFWHYESMEMITLKNNSKTAEFSVRQLDYCVSFSKLFYERLIADDYITLFSPHEAKGLYSAFGLPEFDDLYKKYEKDESLQFRKKVKAKEFMEAYVRERLETGRIYALNVDHANSHNSFKDKINVTNLCCEILQPLVPQKHIDDPDAEIGVCILSAVNLLKIKDFDELESVCDIIVRLLDAVIDHQQYPVKAAENFAVNRRSLGVGITNLAAFLAVNKLKYEDPKACYLIDEWMEAIQYNLLKASCNLAKEKGACKKFNLTKYSQGILPIDTYTKFVDTIVDRKLSFNWEALRADIIKYGLRHSTLTAIMPVESSSVIQNSTNGIEAPRQLLSIKKSKKGNLKQIVPEFNRYKNHYTKAFDMRSNIGMLNIAATCQKYVDMSISTNVYYNYDHFETKEIPMSLIIKEQLYAWKVGIKTLYYLNSNDGYVDSTDESQIRGCESGACSL
jgi:ribonucleoside-diphosphate reductase alpha chain